MTWRWRPRGRDSGRLSVGTRLDSTCCLGSWRVAPSSACHGTFLSVSQHLPAAIGWGLQGVGASRSSNRLAPAGLAARSLHRPTTHHPQPPCRALQASNSSQQLGLVQSLCPGMRAPAVWADAPLPTRTTTNNAPVFQLSPRSLSRPKRGRRTTTTTTTPCTPYYYAGVAPSARTLTASISTPGQTTHYHAPRRALRWSACASFAECFFTFPGRLFLGHSLPLLSLSAIPLPRLPTQPIRREPAVVHPACLWRHTFRRCEYPPAFPSHLFLSTLDPARPCPILVLAALEAPRDKRRALPSIASAPFLSPAGLLL
jgi:hypothetical protein